MLRAEKPWHTVRHTPVHMPCRGRAEFSWVWSSRFTHEPLRATVWPLGSAGGGPVARGGDAITQRSRLSEELFELLDGGGRVGNVATGTLRKNPCHPGPQLEVVRVRTSRQEAYAFPAAMVARRTLITTTS